MEKLTGQSRDWGPGVSLSLTHLFLVLTRRLPSSPRLSSFITEMASSSPSKLTLLELENYSLSLEMLSVGPGPPCARHLVSL